MTCHPYRRRERTSIRAARFVRRVRRYAVPYGHYRRPRPGTPPFKVRRYGR